MRSQRGEEIADSKPQRWEKGFGKEFGTGEDADELEAVGSAMINFHVVIAWIHHPEARERELLVERLLEDGVASVIVGRHDLRDEPRLFIGGRDQDEVRAEKRLRSEWDLGPRWQQPAHGHCLHTGRHDVMQASADFFVALIWGQSKEDLAVELLLVGRRGAGKRRGG
jgi:hypothetical protein